MTRRVQMSLFNTTTQFQEDYTDLNGIAALAGTPTTTAVTGTLVALAATYNQEAANLALKELQSQMNTILAKFK